VELVVAVRDRILSLSPETGKELWSAEGIHRYVCPSLPTTESSTPSAAATLP
jgi:hypothetical protein